MKNIKENNNPRITVIEAAKKMKIDPQVLRIGLQQNKFPFGWAIKSENGNYSYYISKKLFEEAIGGGI